MNKKFLSILSCAGLMTLVSATHCHAEGRNSAQMEKNLKCACESYKNGDSSDIDSILDAWNEYLNEILRANELARSSDNPILSSAYLRNNPSAMESLMSRGRLGLNVNGNLRAESFLHAAYLSNNAAALEYIISREKLDLNGKVDSNNGNTLLHLAARDNNYELVKSLLNIKGINIDSKDSFFETPLFLAVEKGNKDIVELLIEKGANVNLRNKKGRTPLYYIMGTNPKNIVPGSAPLSTVRNEIKDIVELLINKGADINSKDKYKETPLHFAVASNNYEMVELLLNTRGVEIDLKNYQGNTPLRAISRQNYLYFDTDRANVTAVAISKLLIDKGANVNSEGGSGDNILNHAAEHNNYELVKILLNAPKIDINSEDKYRRTNPIYWAVQNNNYKLVELFLNKGADVNLNYGPGESLLHLAVNNRNKDIIELLLSKGADVTAKDKKGNTPINAAALLGSQYPIDWDETKTKKVNKDIVELLIGRGTDVNLKGWFGRTPLHCAAASGNYELVEMLLEKGADVNSKALEGTPLHCAVSSGNYELVEMLLNINGIEIDSKDEQGVTPLIMISWCDFGGISDVAKRNAKKVALAKLLIDKGANVNLKGGYDENTPLNYAIKSNNYELAKLLIDKGANINLKSEDGRTFLHWAVESNNYKIVELLLNTPKIEIDSKDKKENTPLHWAVKSNNYEIAKLLIDKGADVKSKREDGGTLLHCAAALPWTMKFNNYKIVEMLLNIPEIEIDSKDKDGNTALDLAHSYKSEPLIKLFLSATKG